MGTEANNWAIRRGVQGPRMYRRYIVPDDWETWDRLISRLNARYGRSLRLAGPPNEQITRADIEWRNEELLASTGGELVKGMELQV